MQLKWLRLPHFSSLWVSIAFLATYILTISVVIYIQETLPGIPDQEGALEVGIDLDTAWEDLHQIARKPHPYNSKENERVRAYILKRVKALAKEHRNIRVSDDQSSTVLWVDERHGATYFEGSNVIVKVVGTDPHLPSVLFSAHFDSSATAPGATDDGMAVVSLISLIGQFARDPPARTTIFNLNNGEEDELCGSHAFFSHPWSEEPTIFINLEGAGSGGRPILFRSSSAQLTRAFQNTRSPHGTVTSSDAYAIGLIRSQTDFEIYTTQGEMKGLDVSFYVNRDKYHTMQDTIENLNGRQPLWAMLELTRDVGYSLANLEEEEENEQPVYWDILGSTMVVLTLTDFISTLSGTFIGMTFVIIALLVYTIYTRRITLPSRGWAIFPFSLFTGIVMCSFITFCYCWMNPLIIYSVTYPVILSYCSGLILSLLLPAHYFFKPAQYHPTAQRTMVLLQYWGTTAVFKLIYYQVLRRTAFGGFYFIEYFYVCSSLALIVHLVGRVWTERNVHSRATQPSRRLDNGEDVAEPLLSGIPLLSMDYGFAHAQNEARNGNARGRARARNPPLQLRKDRLWILELLIASVLPLILVLQLVLVVCAGLGQTLADGSSPNIVYSGIAFLLFLSFLPFTPFAHQMSPGIFLVAGTVFFWSTFYTVVCFPFGANARLKLFYSHHLDLDTGNSSISVAGINPYLKQALWLPIQLMAGLNVTAHRKVASKLHPMWYIDWSQDTFLNSTVKWSQDPIKGLPIATWETENLYIPPDTELFVQTGERALVSSTARRLNAETAVFTVRGKGSKSCHILFDQNVIDIQVKHVHVDRNHMDRHTSDHKDADVYEDEDEDEDEHMDAVRNKGRDGKSNPSQRIGVDDSLDSAYPMPPGGVPKVNLWSREWDTDFEVTVRWSSDGIEQRKKLPWRSLLASLSPLSHLSLSRPMNGSSRSSRSLPSRTGRIGCNWADNSSDQLPAFDELGEVLPDWTTITTKRPLLTADRAFSV